MKKLSMEELHRISPEEFKQAKKIPLTVVLDNIRSMNNIGSIFRTCDGLAVERLYLCGITACPPNKEINKTALGATESVEWRYFEDSTEAVKQLHQQGYKVYLVEQTDQSVMLQDFRVPQGQKTAIILGNEVFGVSDELLPLVDGAIEIPQFGTKHSFNVTIAAGMVMWEIFKQVC
jgi:tRNA G18 (ribose-2'-O)-methylase SpoU